MPARSKKKPKKAAMKTKVKKAKVRKTKKAPAKAKRKKEKVLGKVTHYYDRIGVAIVELKALLAVGDVVTFRRGTVEFTQPVRSLQIEHASVAKAKRGEQVGLKVKKPIKEGAKVLAT